MILNWSSQQGKQAFSPRYLSHKYCRLLLLLQAVSLNQSSINIAPLFVTQKSVYFILIGFISKEKSCVYFLSPYIHNLSEEGFHLVLFFFFFNFTFANNMLFRKSRCFYSIIQMVCFEGAMCSLLPFDVNLWGR